MKLLKVADDKYVNTERITYINVRRSNKVIIQFQNDVSVGGIGIPPSYLEIKGPDAENLTQWLEANSQHIR